MKIKEVSYMLRVSIPGRQYDYEQLQAVAEVGEGETPEEAYTQLRKLVITQTTQFKKEQNGNTNSEQ